MNATTLVKLRLLFYTIWALGSSWATSMAGVKWDSMCWEEQLYLIAGILMSWTGMMIAFFDKSVWKADEERKASQNSVAPTPPKP